MFIRVLLVISVIFISMSASAQDIEDACQSKIMNTSGASFASIDTSDILDTCQSIPLSEDISIQVLSILLGEPILYALDAFTAITNVKHGVLNNSPLLSVAKPLHSTLEAFNWFMFYAMAFFLFIGLSAQAVRWMRGKSDIDVGEFLSNGGVSRLVVGIFSTPMIGWMTPLQFMAVTFIVIIGYVTKAVVTVLFLASFVGQSLAENKDMAEFDIKENMARSVVLHKCDIQQREYLMSAIQSHLGAVDKASIESTSLYKCLSESSSNTALINVASKNSEVISYDVFTPSIAQTNACITKHEVDIESWGFEKPEQCGSIRITLPNNVNSPDSIRTVESLYLTREIIAEQREMALLLHEYNCRDSQTIVDWAMGAPEYCLKAKINGVGYEYDWYQDPLSQEQRLAFHGLPLGDESKVQMKEAVKQKMSAISNYVTNNTSGMLAHVKDLLAPFEDEDDLSFEMKKKMSDIRSQLIEEQKSTGPLGYSEEDVSFLVDNMKRGAWTAGSLFFGQLAHEIEGKVLADNLSRVFTVPDINMSGTSDLFSVYSDLSSLSMLVSNRNIADIVSDEVSDTLLPRINMYTDNLDCWYSQVDCDVPPLNPFTYLGERGLKMIDHGLIGYAGTTLIDLGVRRFMGQGERGGLMLARTFSEIYILYILIGIVLAVIIPAMPTLKLMVMLINWSYDIVKELMGLQITLCMSVITPSGHKFLSQDVRAALARLFGLGLYLLFVLLGLVVMFLMFSFLFSMNVLIVGALSFIVGWTGSPNSIESMVMFTIYDVIITVILFYQVKNCTPYIEKFPRALSEEFGIDVSSSSGIAEQVMQRLNTAVKTNVSDMLTFAFKR